MIDTKGLVSKVNTYKGVDSDFDADDYARQIADQINIGKGPTTPDLNINAVSSFPSLRAANDNVVEETDEPDDLLADIARESTQKEVVDGILALVDENEQNIGLLRTSAEENVTHLEKIETALDRVVSAITTGLESLASIFTGQLSDLAKVTGGITASMDRDYALQATEFARQQRAGVVAEAQDHDQGQDLESEVKPILSNVLQIFEDMFEKIKSQVMSFIEGGGHLSLIDRIKDNALQMAIKGAGLLVLMTTSLDLWQRPDGLMRYFDAFKNVWAAISDIFGNFTTRLSDWWNSEGSTEFNTIGAFINDAVIYYIGTALPATLRFVSDTILNLVDNVTTAAAGIANIVRGIINIISGIFTWNPVEGAALVSEGLTQLDTGIQQVIGAVFSFVWTTLDSITTYIVRLLRLDAIFGMQDDQSFFNRIGEAFTNMWNGIVAYFDRGTLAVLTDIGKVYVWIYDQILTYLARLTNFDKLIGMSENETLFNFLWERIQALIQIITDFIPSKNDIIRYMNDTVKSWGLPQTVQDMLMMELDPEPGAKITVPAPTVTPIDPDRNLRDMEKKVESPRSGGFALGIFNDNKTVTSVSGGGGGGGAPSYGRVTGSPSTRPEQSWMDRILQGSNDFFKSR